jgi:RNA recognition motif-containing protein
VKIYVGNLPYDATKEDLQAEFAAFGTVGSVDIIIDRTSGRSKGFAFVEMPSINEGQAAITKLNGKTLKDRAISVSAARPRSDDRGSGGGYGGGRSGGYGGSGNRRRNY